MLSQPDPSYFPETALNRVAGSGHYYFEQQPG